MPPATWRRRSSTASPRWNTSIFPGNDLVWLNDPAHRGRSADLRLLRRILTPRERLLVQVSTDPDRMLWSLWAAKEAAFKAVVRERPSTVFSPARFELEPGRDESASQVVYQEYRFTVFWTQGPDWVHAWLEAGPLIAVDRLALGGDPSQGVRDLALRSLRSAGYPDGVVEGRPPAYRIGDALIPISLSHDGPWLAVSAPFFRIDGSPESSKPTPRR